jgi:hypothetical protein
MPITFEEVTGEVTTPRGVDNPETSAAAPASQDNLREKLLAELALLRERQARLFTD